ncbi:uncharacterized protein LOC117561984 isoform X4 [Gymnodraco acuticeps]|nr:uncharacterized protein LOC117561984 isoform X4 [Gymnodraco acuticeps]
MASAGRALADLLRDAANQLENSPRTANAPVSSPPPHPLHNGTPRHPVDAEVSRLFGPYMGGRRTAGRQTLSGPAHLHSYTHLFCCLEDKNAALVPNRYAKERLAAAGFGEKRLTFKGSHTDSNEFLEFLMDAYPKLRNGGGFELLKISGTTRSRHLIVIPCPNEGYYVRYLKDPQTQIGHSTVFIRPMQRTLNLDPACRSEGDNVLIGPNQKCVICGEEFPFSRMKDHSNNCMRPSQSSGEVQIELTTERASGSQVRFESTFTGAQGNETTRARNTRHSVPPQEMLPSPEVVDIDPTEESGFSDWRIAPDPTEAAKMFKEDILSQHATGKSLCLTMDLGDSAEERERAVLTFYKKANVEWACPLTCTLKGDPAIGDGVTLHFFATIISKLQAGFEMKFVPGGTLLFEGEQDHLIPSTSHLLLESDFFVVAGRMIGHSFLHDGPCLGGLSPAVLHVLFGGSPEEATIDIKDCVDLDIRETIKLLEGTAELSSEEKKLINELALSWDLPLVTCDNRRWLFDKLILHAVLGRTSRQVKQLRRGLKETLIWPLLTERKDAIPLLFPRASDLQCTPRMVLEKINWPTQDEDEDSEVSLEDSCRLTGFLRTFIEMASPVILGKLVQFWIGWNVLPRHGLNVTVVESNFPSSSTCFHQLKLPGHYKEYCMFERDILAAIWSTETGFGMV